MTEALHVDIQVMPLFLDRNFLRETSESALSLVTQSCNVLSPGRDRIQWKAQFC